MAERASQIVSSALWAATGDALGFITELTDAVGLRRRIHADRLTGLVEWHRLIGGRYGPEVCLPAGSYSDDTQLRLATSRAIRGNGFFDVEAFAKIELPVWLNYALGAGVGSKAAAGNLANVSVNWFSNFYSTKVTSYLESGGNGAAMRIQPHVWACGELTKPSSFLPDVIRNAVCTHGNMRGVLGAVFHALILAMTLNDGKVPGPEQWRDCVTKCSKTLEIVQDDRELSVFWLPVWEQRTGCPLKNEITSVLKECLADITAIEGLDLSEEEGYREAVSLVGGLDPRTRGSGTKTALLAGALAWGGRRKHPSEILLIAANVLGSDTDSIASMAGAILGAVSSEQPVILPIDHEYIEAEAIRLNRIRNKENCSSFIYPDLARWSPPKNQVSAVSRHNGRIEIAGLGELTPVQDPVSGKGRELDVWQWLRTPFGQTILAKHRLTASGVSHSVNDADASRDKAKSRNEQGALFPVEEDVSTRNDTPVRTLDSITSEAMAGGLDPTTIGAHILELATQEGGIELCIAYVAIVAKTRRARIARMESKTGGATLSNI